MSSFRQTLTHFWDFLKNPKDYKLAYHHQFKLVKKDLIQIFKLDLLVTFIGVATVAVLQELLSLDFGPNKIEELINQPFLLLLVGVLIAPVFEELIFRFMITFRRAYPYLLIMGLSKFFFSASDFKVLRIFRKFWSYLFPFIFYSSSLLFGWVHSSNYVAGEDVGPLIAIATIPQILLGLLFGFVRIKYGLRYSVLLHGMHNGFLLTVALFFYHLFA